MKTLVFLSPLEYDVFAKVLVTLDKDAKKALINALESIDVRSLQPSEMVTTTERKENGESPKG